MIRLIRNALVIARRDYIATVWSRSFLFFLLGPMIAGTFGGVLGNIGNKVDSVALRPSLAVVAPASVATSVRSAYERMQASVGDLPELRLVTPSGDPAAQARTLLAVQDRGASAVLTGLPGPARLTGPRPQIDALSADVRLILDEIATADAMRAQGIKRPEAAFTTTIVDPARGATSANRHIVARAAQLGLFVLTLMLAGMLLSNLVEEKSNKVIEVLAAAVPVDAIFLGKLIAMLSVSLTGIAVWSTLLAGGIIAKFGGGAVPAPAVGWAVFTILGVLYFVMNYMLLGGLFLGIGAQASSVREVQTLSMPITMAQLAIFALASAVVDDLTTPLAFAAAAFPLSSPTAMIARAAQDAAIWPHVAALVWQALWVAFIVRFAARRFRSGVLKSGAQSRPFWRRKSRDLSDQH